MLRTHLRCMFLVIISCANADSDAKGNCDKGGDDAILIQSRVKVHDSSRGKAAEEESSGCSAKTTKSTCEGSGNTNLAACNWDPNAETCKTGCKYFGTEASCMATGYCGWAPGRGYDYQMNYEAGGCKARMNAVLGGDGSTGVNHYRADDMTILRQEYVTKTRFNSVTGKWEACGQGPDCWVGSGKRDIVVNFQDAKYTKYAMEIRVDCEDKDLDEVVVPTMEAEKNARIRVWYNLAEDTQADYKHRVKGWELKYRVTPDDANPILRIEASRRGGSSTGHYKMKAPKVMGIRSNFEQCMDAKEHIGQCLEMFGTAPSVLRSDPAKQLACLNGDTSIPDCTAWSACLSTLAKDTISKIVRASQRTSLLETGAQQQTQVSCQNNGPESCIDWATYDIEALECDCWETVQTLSEAQIHARACSESRTCCSWKTAHCSGSLVENSSASALLESKSADSALDESLSGKRTC